MPGMPEGIPEDMQPFLKRFFGDQVPELRSMPRGMAPRGMLPRSQPSVGMGSGVIIDSSGLILTNNHVAGGGGKGLCHLVRHPGP